MKKAKQYAEEYLASVKGDETLEQKADLLASISIEMYGEAQQLIKDRKAHSNRAIVSIFLEIDKKFNAFVRRAGLGDEHLGSFKAILSKLMPEIKPLFDKAERGQRI